MSFQLVISASAQKELAAIALWLEEKRSGYGSVFIDEYENALAHLIQYPLAQYEFFHQYRMLKIGRFQYYLLYEIIGRKVEVYMILHGRSEPLKRKRKH